MKPKLVRGKLQRNFNEPIILVDEVKQGHTIREIVDTLKSLEVDESRSQEFHDGFENAVNRLIIHYQQLHIKNVENVEGLK